MSRHPSRHALVAILVTSAAAHAGPRIGMPMGQQAPVASTRLLYYGGRVLSHVQVVQVLWGPNVSSTIATGMGPFYQAVLESPYVDWLGEYDTIGVATNLRAGMGATTETKQQIGRGAFVATVQITPSNTATSLADADVMAELAHQIDIGVLPAPIDDGHGGYRTFYAIDFPVGIQITDPTGGRTCVESCAYHSAGVYKGKNLAFGLHPDLQQPGCSGGCGFGGSALASATIVHSHELIEAITDPDIVIRILQAGISIDYPVGWFADGNGSEIGDICNGMAAMVGTATVQTEWSNAQGACITTVNGLPTCIDAKPGACSPCTADGQCTGDTLHCATGSDFKSGECVHCVDATACMNATPTCDKSTTDLDDTCRACTANTDCAAPTPLCAIAATGTVAVGSCVECLANTDCTNAMPVCNAAATCTGCTADTDCGDPMNPSCNTGTGVCGPDAAGCCSSSHGLAPGDVLVFALVGLLLGTLGFRRPQNAS